MTCPKCKKPSSVGKTITDAIVVRTRECIRCAIRWITDERTRKGSIVAISGPLAAVSGQAPDSSQREDLDQREEKKTGGGQKKPQMATNSQSIKSEPVAVNAMIAVFCEEYPIRYPGSKYQVSPKDRGQAQLLAKAGFAGDWRATVKRYLGSTSPFFVEAKHSLALLVGNVNQFATESKSNGTSRDVRVGWAPAEVKDRHAGTVEDF